MTVIRNAKKRRVEFLGATALVALAPFAVSQNAWGQASSLTAGGSTGIETVMVTAQRFAQDASKVPISIEAFTQQDIDQQGLQGISDLAARTPDLTYSQGGSRQSISIRGITSSVGAATTGIYIDDTPIQVRNAGFTSSEIFPHRCRPS